MTNRDSVQIELLLGELKEVIKFAPNDVPALCRVGKKLSEFGRERDASKAYRAAVEALRRAARSGSVQGALEFEEAIYAAFVQPGDEEEHFRRCFADWKEDLAALGRRLSKPVAPPSGEHRTAFVLHIGILIGHTEVLLKLLESRPRGSKPGLDPVICVFRGADPAFLARCRAAGVEVLSAQDALGVGATWDARLAWTRQQLAERGIDTCIWVSVPATAVLALSMRLAPVQVFWAMRFHPFSGPYIDGYITWGADDEVSRRYGDQDWQVVPLPFAHDGTVPERSKVDELRARFPEPILLGTLAREEKIHKVPFLKAVADILTAHPQAGFLWTGQREHAGIKAFFDDAGVSDRCHFVGWVDTRLHAAALDIFLDTFPHGCGVTSYHAFAASTPLLSHLGPYTIFGTHFWRKACALGGSPDHPRLAAPDEHLILCAADEAEYVRLAGRLISDAAWREKIGARGRAFFQEEVERNEAYAERFFATVRRIAATKLGRPAS